VPTLALASYGGFVRDVIAKGHQHHFGAHRHAGVFLPLNAALIIAAPSTARGRANPG
jgi:hypothetical protein